MTFIIDRRRLILTGTLGLAAWSIPGLAQGPNWIVDGFTHNVASGEPGPDSMLLWTRYVPKGGGAAKLRVELSETADFARIAGGGEMVTGPWRDHTVKISVGGLRPGTRYHYRFVAPDGSFSPVGRTRTLPEGMAGRFCAAIFSCSNIGFGYFNAYAHAAARDDVDLAIHLGDYLYEYGPGVYPSGAEIVDGRLPQPMTEIVHLQDYRLRYASYRSDPDLQALHAAKPMIVSWDDHESANNSWEGGAENHQAESEGVWSVRKAAAIQAFREWLPVSDEPWKAYEIGELATLFRTDTRLAGRSEEVALRPLLAAAEPARALAQFRDGPWQDPARSMLGSTQELWLDQALHASIKAGKRWQVAGFGTIMGNLKSPPDALGLLRPDASEGLKAYVRSGMLAAEAGLPNDLDNWGGFPAARARFLGAAQAAGADLLVICGDSHNGWAFDLAQGGKPAGVEFAGHSVTSSGYEGAVADPAAAARAMVAANPELKWCDTSRRGYMALTLTPDEARNDWLFVDTVRERSARASVGHTAVVKRGRNAMA